MPSVCIAKKRTGHHIHQVVAPSKIKQTVPSSLHLLPRAPSQLHMSSPYNKAAPSSNLPARRTGHWQCWTPGSVTQRFTVHELAPCPPRITLAGLFQASKRSPVPRRHGDNLDPCRERLIKNLAVTPKQPRHFCGKRAKNKRKLHFPVPVDRPPKLVEEGKQLLLFRPYVQFLSFTSVSRIFTLSPTPIFFLD